MDLKTFSVSKKIAALEAFTFAFFGILFFSVSSNQSFVLYFFFFAFTPLHWTIGLRNLFESKSYKKNKRLLLDLLFGLTVAGGLFLLKGPFPRVAKFFLTVVGSRFIIWHFSLQIIGILKRRIEEKKLYQRFKKLVLFHGFISSLSYIFYIHRSSFTLCSELFYASVTLSFFILFYTLILVQKNIPGLYNFFLVSRMLLYPFYIINLFIATALRWVHFFEYLQVYKPKFSHRDYKTFLFSIFFLIAVFIQTFKERGLLDRLGEASWLSSGEELFFLHLFLGMAHFYFDRAIYGSSKI